MRYTSDDELKSGLHLGGLGCGTLQIFSDGTRGVFTGLNNWEKPLGDLHWFRQGNASDYRFANPFAIFTEHNGRKVSKFLQTSSLDNCPVVKKIEFEGEFPVAKLTFIDDELPVKVTLRAFSPFIPKDYKNSGLPGCLYEFTVENTAGSPVSVSLLASAINAAGAWNVGRYNEIEKKDGLFGITFHKNCPHPRDERAGLISLVGCAKEGELSYLGQWQYAKEPFRGNREDRRFDAWKFFQEDGTLPNTEPQGEAQGEFDEWMAALALKFKLAPGKSKKVHFIYSWFMPNHYLGHAYQNWFKDSFSAAKYLYDKKDTLLDKTTSWQAVIKRTAMPEWLKDALINNLYVYTSASWWTKKGDFALYENTVKYPLMDSLDVRYYGTLPLVLFFPELEKRTMELFVKFQRKDGHIPHDLGKAQIGCPSNGTTAGKPWKDLNTKFVLMALRDYLWTRDTKFLKRNYPAIKRALNWQFRQDKDGDGLPENEGKDSTFDLWDFYGTSSYTSSIHLASLKAGQKLAEILKDAKTADECRLRFEKGTETFEKKLWNGSYYRAAADGVHEAYNACVLGQLNGQWYAHLLGLGYIAQEEHIKKAVRTILQSNAASSEFGAVNSVMPDGEGDGSSYHAKNIWPGETYAFCALAIYEGFIDEGLELAKRTWENIAYRLKSPWSQSDVVFADSGSFGDGELYLRNVAIWALAFALAKYNRNVAKFLKKLEPNLKFETGTPFKKIHILKKGVPAIKEGV